MPRSCKLAFLVLALGLFLAPHAFAAIVKVQGPVTNNYSGNSKAYGSNVAAGDVLIVSADNNSFTSQSVTSTGAGCSTTSWIKAAEVSFSTNVVDTTWVGVASGSGACTVTVTPINSGHNGIIVSEYSGVSISPIYDASGSAAVNGQSTFTTTGTPNPSYAGEYGYMSWAGTQGVNPTNAGWTTGLQNTYDGTYTSSTIPTGVPLSGTLGPSLAAVWTATLISLIPATPASFQYPNLVLTSDW